MVALADMKTAVIILGLIALVAGAMSIALAEFQSEIGCGGDNCVAGNSTSFAYNASQHGLEGVDNTTSFLSTIGTIIAVVALVGIVVGAFKVGRT